MRQGGSIGGKRKGRVYPKEGAPLRRIIETLRPSGTIFSPDRVLLECGHEGTSWGGLRARCPSCKKTRPATVEVTGRERCSYTWQVR